MMNDGVDDDDDGSAMDLSALDPDIDAPDADRFTNAVMARIGASARVPAIPLDPLFGLWSIPPAFLIAASILAVAALGLSRTNARSRSIAPATVAEAVGVPSDYLAVTLGAPQP